MGPPLGGVVVEAARYPCEGYDACQILASTTSEANGSWSLWVPSGRYLLSTNGTGGYGGATASVNVTTPPVAPVPLVADPQIVYENATFVLPDWNPLAGYAANCNLPLPCPGVRVPGGSGGQVPLTSWTQDGAFYVNTSLELVFYSFANRSVRAIAPWVPLHDDLMSYDGVEDTEWITADGSYVYEFGCATSCTNDSPVSLYAVNVSTGRTFEGTLRGVDGELFYRNAQMDLIGPEGNLSIASIIDQSGIDIGYDLWSGAQWDLATLPYFEANNIYWVAPLQSYFDVQAGGSRADLLTQLKLEGTGATSSLQVVATTSFASGFECNGVEGLAFNATSQTLAFTAENETGAGITDVFWINPNGTLVGLARSWNDTSPSSPSWPDAPPIPNLESSEHRPSLLSNGPGFAGFWSGWFDNRSWLVDPSTGAWYSANVPFDHAGPVIGPAGQGLLSPAALEGLFLNSTYSLMPWSYDCRTSDGSCPILGNTTPTTVPGTVWWIWRSGSPEFPYPATAPLAETGPPSDPTMLGFEVQGEDITVRWDPPTGGADPLLNYTLFVGTSPVGPAEGFSVAPQATSFTVGGLLPDTPYYFRLEAWNLHWHSAGAAGSVTTGFPTFRPISEGSAPGRQPSDPPDLATGAGAGQGWVALLAPGGDAPMASVGPAAREVRVGDPTRCEGSGVRPMVFAPGPRKSGCPPWGPGLVSLTGHAP